MGLDYCLFCGAVENVNTGPWVGKNNLDSPWYVQCRGCGAGGPTKATQEDAIAAWNNAKQEILALLPSEDEMKDAYNDAYLDWYENHRFKGAVDNIYIAKSILDFIQQKLEGKDG
jgi:hypothetical protein